MSRRIVRIDVTGLGFRAGMLAAVGVVLAGLVATGINLAHGGRPVAGAALVRLTAVSTLSGPSPAGLVDPALLIRSDGATEALVAQRGGGSCLLYPTAATSTTPAAVTASTTVPHGVRGAAYCSAAELPSGALAVASVTASGAPTVATVETSGALHVGTAPGSGAAMSPIFGSLWLTAAPSGVYLVDEVHGTGTACCAIAVWHSTDGLSYTLGALLPQPGGGGPDAATFFGPAVIDTAVESVASATDHLYMPFTHAVGGADNERGLFLAASSDGGSTWTVHQVFLDATGTTVAAQYPVAAVDTGGAVYVAWSDVANVFYAVSKDSGATFAPAQVVDATGSLNVLPAIVAGDPGHIAIAWYSGSGTDAMGSRAVDLDTWRPMLAVSGNAAGTAPNIQRLTLNGVAVHRGAVCLLGDGCTDAGDGGPYDNRLGSRLALALAPQTGGVEVAYVEDAGTLGGSTVRIVAEACGDRILVRPPHPLASCG